MRGVTLRAAALATGAMLAVAGLSGCGRETESAAPATEGEQGTAVTISSPEHQQEYRAEERDGSLSRTFNVRGTARADQRIRVVAGCQTGRCTGETNVGEDGRWAVSLTITVSPAQPSSRLRAEYVDDGVAGAPAGIEITLRAPEERERETTTGTTSTAREEEPESEPEPDPAPTAPASGTDTPAAPTGGAAVPERLTMIGDSLAVGTKPYLEGLLPGWTVTTDARTGRPLAEGLARLRATSLGAGPHVLAFSLFTNDGPRSVTVLDAAVRETARRAGTGGCAIWATIVAPPVGGVDYAAANTRLRRLGSELSSVRIVDWADAVRQHPEWMAPDGVHATPDGYRNRARLYAEEAQACAA